MTSYGEGDYLCKTHGKIKPQLRSVEHMEKHIWEPLCPNCSEPLSAIATDEFSEIHNNGIYSLTKNVQESMLMQIGKLYSLPVTSLRCFNVYGPRQSLSNPYTGVSAIFISRLKNNNPPVVYEDGLQSRDFVSVHDVVDALIASMESAKANYEICNIGSGTPTPIRTIAEKIALLLEKKISPQLNKSFRKNDIRHCFADISKAKQLLNYQPTTQLKGGLKNFYDWFITNKEVLLH